MLFLFPSPSSFPAVQGCFLLGIIRRTSSSSSLLICLPLNLSRNNVFFNPSQLDPPTRVLVRTAQVAKKSRWPKGPSHGDSIHMHTVPLFISLLLFLNVSSNSFCSSFLRTENSLKRRRRRRRRKGEKKPYYYHQDPSELSSLAPPASATFIRLTNLFSNSGTKKKLDFPLNRCFVELKPDLIWFEKPSRKCTFILGGPGLFMHWKHY